MIITREVINKNIIYHECNFANTGTDYLKQTYRYEDLVRKINGYKNLLLKNGAKVNETILISLTYGIDSLAAFIASAELGLSLVIVNAVKIKKIYCIDTKIKILLPINYFLVDKNNLSIDKTQFFSMLCDKTIYEDPTDFSENLEVFATNKTVHHLCTSSGTSGLPKRIEHTHEFIYEISNRNTSYLYKNIMIGGRPTHGSSLATFYLPSVISKKTENIYLGSIDDIMLHRKQNTFYFVDSLFDCLQVIYAERFEKIINNLSSNPNLTIFVLCAIRKEWLKYIELGKIKNIISLYGTSETSGPMMMQYANDEHFATDRFELLDNYYPITTKNGTIETLIPVYNRYNNTQDLVENHKQGAIKLIGRKDLIRINDLIVPCRTYDLELNRIFNNCTLTFDTLCNKIYLTFWYTDTNAKNKVEKFSNYLKLQSEGRHFINDYDQLEYSDFLNGIKLDQEMLRQHYRLKSENN